MPWNFREGRLVFLLDVYLCSSGAEIRRKSQFGRAKCEELSWWCGLACNLSVASEECQSIFLSFKHVVFASNQRPVSMCNILELKHSELKDWTRAGLPKMVVLLLICRLVKTHLMRTMPTHDTCIKSHTSEFQDSWLHRATASLK